MILFEAKYHFKKAVFIGPIFFWNVFLFWVIWFTYSSDKMSTLDTIGKDYDKNIVLRDCQRQAFEYLHQQLSHDRLLHYHVFWDYFWDAYRDREPARTDNSVWEIGRIGGWGFLYLVLGFPRYFWDSLLAAILAPGALGFLACLKCPSIYY
jgi:hypothetical protein